MLNAGIIGLGVGERHIRAYQEHPGCRVHCLCDFADDKAEEVLHRYPGISLVETADDIIENPDIDIVSIASFDNYHADQVVRAVENGKHVFVEKPLCLFPEEAALIRRALDANPKIRLSSNLNLRTCPRFMWVRELAGKGQMGDLFSIEADYLWGRKEKLTLGWRKDMPFYSIIHGASVHMIDLVIWLTGKRPVEVSGYGNQIATSGTGFRFNDFSTLLLKFEDGMVAKVASSGGCVHSHFHRLLVYGTQKTFIHEHSGASLISSCRKDEPPEPVILPYPGEQKGNMILSFVDNILNPSTPPLVTAEDIFTTMSVCFAAEQAVDTGKSETINYI